MSKENIAKFQDAIAKKPELLEKLKGSRTPEAVVAAAKAEGFDFTAEELAEYGRAAARTGKLSDEELDKVAGGERNTQGYLITFAWYGCTQWTGPCGHGCIAINGQCGTCDHWYVAPGSADTAWGECMINKE